MAWGVARRDFHAPSLKSAEVRADSVREYPLAYANAEGPPMPPVLPDPSILTGHVVPRSFTEYRRDVATYRRFCVCFQRACVTCEFLVVTDSVDGQKWP